MEQVRRASKVVNAEGEGLALSKQSTFKNKLAFNFKKKNTIVSSEIELNLA